jgi:hypothetical protein
MIRYSSAVAGITSAWRALFGSRVFVFVGPPRNVDERGRTLEMMAVEGLREE